ncbi:Cytochrome c oxidase-assembly factor COX23, mitochondrial [Wickerhamiella sorbophila]|uniref:Cytochrome c oxidase-assembly factor COX23, mitochondrial n=1 Tax=Wickerhamiella sorbophila TaxID=45607 RepID=A0A2T0FHH9_9ASCO|nr:Cytochrome c oxidase-assembly factor COX23, mitochondrial [Wickerhamiella sorbophila]PRT54451.1 Cytochrome c oxidase-assembly factor COX23, mitochondrial [Wickerhamiella sorbophila]
MAGDDGVERDPSKVDFVKNGDIKLFPDDPTSEKKLMRFRNKGHSEFYDPCSEAAKMSMKCLERNNYDRKKCKDYFQAYRDCTAEWRKKV